MEDENKILNTEMDLMIQYPSIKIIKNTKGYNFEFKILNLDMAELERVHDSINKLVKKWEAQNA
jgi:hypothetical protein